LTTVTFEELLPEKLTVLEEIVLEKMK